MLCPSRVAHSGWQTFPTHLLYSWLCLIVPLQNISSTHGCAHCAFTKHKFKGKSKDFKKGQQKIKGAFLSTRLGDLAGHTFVKLALTMATPLVNTVMNTLSIT